MASDSDQALPRAKKSVALSGTAAGNTAICTVGHSGNDLHYRGYDIVDFAETAEFEEIAYLLIHGQLPNQAELDAYRAKLKSLRGLPLALKHVLEAIPATAHPMDVMRTACSVMGSCEPEKMSMFVILFRNIKMAAIAIVPNVFAALLVLGLMGWLRIPLDLMTITVAAISIGIAVDDTIPIQ